LDNQSQSDLRVFADWLEEGGDPVAEGVRWLADGNLAPTMFLVVPMIAWNIKVKGKSWLPDVVNRALTGKKGTTPVVYYYQPHNAAKVYHHALLYAARTYVALSPHVKDDLAWPRARNG
jgi:hypothetical protein